MLLACNIGWHCPRDVSIVDRIEKYINKDAPAYDGRSTSAADTFSKIANLNWEGGPHSGKS